MSKFLFAAALTFLSACTSSDPVASPVPAEPEQLAAPAHVKQSDVPDTLQADTRGGFVNFDDVPDATMRDATLP